MNKLLATLAVVMLLTQGIVLLIAVAVQSLFTTLTANLNLTQLNPKESIMTNTTTSQSSVHTTDTLEATELEQLEFYKITPITLTLSAQERADAINALSYNLEHNGFDEDGNGIRFYNALVKLHAGLADGTAITSYAELKEGDNND